MKGFEINIVKTISINIKSHTQGSTFKPYDNQTLIPKITLNKKTPAYVIKQGLGNSNLLSKF